MLRLPERLGALALLLVVCASSGPAEKPRSYRNILLWPEGSAPGAVGDLPIDKPYLTAVLPPEGRGNGTAVIIGPGGGNVDLFAHQEGIDVAERLST